MTAFIGIHDNTRLQELDCRRAVSCVIRGEIDRGEDSLVEIEQGGGIGVDDAGVYCACVEDC